MTTTAPDPTSDGDTLSWVRVSTGELADAAKAVARLTTKVPVPILAGVRLCTDAGKLLLQRYDYNTAVVRRVDAEGALPGPLVVDAAQLHATLARLDRRQPVTVTVAEDRCLLTQGRRRVGLRLLPTEDYPQLPPLPGPQSDAPEFTLGGEQLRFAVSKLSPFVSTDDMLPVLGCVCLEAAGGEVTAWATDRFSAATVRLPAHTPGTEEVRVLVPRADYASGLFTDDESVRVVVDGSWLHLVGATASVSTLPPSGEFPRMARIFPDTATGHVRFDPVAFLTALKFVDVTGGRHGKVRLGCGPGRILLANAAGDQDAELVDEVPAELDGAELTGGFTMAFRAAAVARAVAVWGKGQPVELHTSGTAPVVFTGSAHPELRVLVMTMRDDA